MNLEIIIIIQRLKGIQQEESPLAKDWFRAGSITYCTGEHTKEKKKSTKIGIKPSRIIKYYEIRESVRMSFTSSNLLMLQIIIVYSTF